MIADVLHHFKENLYDLQDELDSSPLDKQSLIEKIRNLTETAFSKANIAEPNTLTLKEHFFSWIDTHATQTDLIETFIDEVRDKYEEAQNHTNTQLKAEREQVDKEWKEESKKESDYVDQVIEADQKVGGLVTQNCQASENHLIAAQKLHEKIVDAKKEIDQTSDQVHKIQKFMEDLDQSLETLLQDYQAKLEASQQEGDAFLSVKSIRETFHKLFTFVKESLSIDNVNLHPQAEVNDTWNKLVDLIVAEECFAIKHIKKYFIQRMKDDVNKARDDLKKHGQNTKYARLLKEAELSFYRDILGHLIDITRQKQSALKKYTASKEEQKINTLKEEISFINKEFLHYFGEYRRLYSPDSPLLTPPTDLIVSKHYANLGYSKWDHICELFDLEENEGWQIPLAIPAIMRKNSKEFLQWVDKYPHSASMMAADLALTYSILKREDEIEKLRKTLQAHTFTLTFLDALGFCKDEPLQAQHELKFKALADFIAQAPLLVTVLAQLMSSKSIWEKIVGGVVDILTNSTIQHLNRSLAADTRNTVQIAISILKGDGLQQILIYERNRRLIQLAGVFKQHIQHPKKVYTYLQEQWKIWCETIQRSSGQEKIERLFVQIVMPIGGTVAAVAYLIAGVVKSYFSFWKGLSLAIAISGISFYLSHRFYQSLNLRYKTTYKVIEDDVKGQFQLDEENPLTKKNAIEKELKTCVNGEIDNLQKLYYIPVIPKRLLGSNTNDNFLVKRLGAHLQNLLNSQLNAQIQKGKKESVELYVQVFNEIFVMKDIKHMVEFLVSMLEIKTDLLADFPNHLQLDESCLKDLQKDLQVSLDQEGDGFLHQLNDSVFLLARHLIDHWLKEKLSLLWGKYPLDLPNEADFIKIPPQDMDSKINEAFTDKGLALQYQTLNEFALR